MNYQLIKFLKGNNGYKKYFQRLRLDESADCPELIAATKDQDHVMFRHLRFLDERSTLSDVINRQCCHRTILWR